MKHPYTLLLSCSLAFAPLMGLRAQCEAGELPVTIRITTDLYGKETYWQLVPTGQACGTGTIGSGGNTAVGCSGAGQGTEAPAGGYAANTTYTAGPYCLPVGGTYDLISIDWFGDDQAAFGVFVDGASVGSLHTPGGYNVFTFTVELPAQLDMGVIASTTPLWSDEGSSITVSGTAHNFGIDAITGFQLNYRIDAGLVQSMAVSANIASGSDHVFTHDIPWAPNGPASSTLRIWCAQLNGSEDLEHANDTLTRAVVVNPIIPDRLADYLAAPPELVEVANSDDDLLVPRDLDFHPDRARDELWVINKDVENSGGSTVKFIHPGATDQSFLWQRDNNAWHFMSLPAAIAFGDNNNFATAPGVFDANHDGGIPFTGPTLWSSDPDIYAQNEFGPLGSHLDMVHVNPNSQGIAHDRWNRFWVVDGYNRDIVMNDFRSDHGPGNDYHGNAVIRRYSDFTITRDPNDHIVSHCVLDKRSGWLYIVDNGGRRVLRMDTRTGTVSGNATFNFNMEPYVEYTRVTGYTWEVLVSTGLDKPSGIDIVGDHLLVTDHANGDIVVYDISGSGAPEVGRIHTGTAGIMGIKVGPDGRIWYVNATTHQLMRADPSEAVGIAEHDVPALTCYPSPASQHLFITGEAGLPAQARVELLDAQGRTVLGTTLAIARNGIDISGLPAGPYAVRTPGRPAQRIVVVR